MRIRRLPEAIRDVDDIWLHIAADDPTAATRLVERLANGISRLVDFLKASLQGLRSVPTRSVTVGNYLVGIELGRKAALKASSGPQIYF